MNLAALKNKLIVSVQAAKGEPLYDEICINALLKSVVNGGASGVRVAGTRDVKNAKSMLNVPVIGLTKPDKLPDNWKEVVYITSSIKDVNDLIDAGADIIALDATSRIHEFDLKDAVDIIHSKDRYAMADIATLDDGIMCEKLGFDILSTTLSGYTKETESDNEEPDFELLKNLVNTIKIPVFLEGRVWEPKHVKMAFDIGAYSVVIGSAITRPQLITKRFVKEII